VFLLVLAWTAVLLFVLPRVAGVTGMCHHALAIELVNFLHWLASNCDSPNFCLLEQLGFQM
jgi:hypothetical protein